MILIINNTTDKKNVLYLPKLLDYFKQIGRPYKLINSIDEMKEITNVSGIILSGSAVSYGNKDFINNKETFIKDINAIYTHHNIPVLGICFGSQLLNVVWGGKLGRFERAFCKTHPITFDQDTFLGKRIPSRTQDFRFCCKFYIKEIPDNFRKIAHTKINGKNIPCIFRHKRLPIFGSLCHPEYSADTFWLLDAFLDYCKTRKS